MSQSTVIQCQVLPLFIEINTTYIQTFFQSNGKIIAQFYSSLTEKVPQGKQSKSNHAANSKQQPNSTWRGDLDECSSYSGNNCRTTYNAASPVYDDHVDDDLDQTHESETTMMELHSNDIYLDKIKMLSLKVNQQSMIIKEKDALIKRLRSTMIGIN